MKKKKLIGLWAEWRIHVGIGQGHFYDIKNALLMGASLAVILRLSSVYAIGLSVGLYLGFFVVGYIDIHYLKLMQCMAVKGTKKYNPHLAQVGKK